MARGDTHPIDIVVEVLNGDSVLRQIVPDGFSAKMFPKDLYKLRGRVCLSMVRPAEGAAILPTLHHGVLEVLLGCRYENGDDDHVNKSKAAQRVVAVLDAVSHVAPDGSATGQMMFLGWSNVDSGRQNLPQELVSVSFQFPLHIPIVTPMP